MSTSYYVFAEARVKGKWQCLCPFYRILSGELQVIPLYDNYSRSYFSDSYDVLRLLNEGISVSEDSFSDEVLSWLKSDVTDFDSATLEEILRPALSVPYHSFKQYLGDVNRCDYCDIVKEQDIYLFEHHDIDEFETITPQEYSKLDSAVQSLYRIYHWDNPYGWRAHFKQILRRVDICISQFCSVNTMEAPSEIRLLVFVF